MWAGVRLVIRNAEHNTSVPFTVTLSTAAVTGFSTDTGILLDEVAVLRDIIKRTLVLRRVKWRRSWYILRNC